MHRRWQIVASALTAVASAVPHVSADVAAENDDQWTTAPNEFRVQGGFCDHLAFLHNLLFVKEGNTLSGAPYYKADGVEEYLYWDPDCGGKHDGTKRWIFDSDRPSIRNAFDLDNHRACEYDARIASDNRAYPPQASAGWMMWCKSEDGLSKVKRQVNIVLLPGSATLPATTQEPQVVETTTTEHTMDPDPAQPDATSLVAGTAETSAAPPTAATTTATETSTEPVPNPATEGESTTESTTPGTTAAETSTTAPPTTTTTATTTTTTAPPRDLHLFGACPYKGFLNGLKFRVAGATACGRPFYEAEVPADSVMGAVPPPSLPVCADGAAADVEGYASLTADGQCSCASGGSEDDAASAPLTFCGGVVKDVYRELPGSAGLLCQCNAGAEPNQTTGDAVCCVTEDHIQAHLEATDRKQYLYYDADCAGVGEGAVGRWVVDADMPDTNLASDLDGDRQCNYHGKLETEDERPPAAANWSLWCGHGWHTAEVLLSAADTYNAQKQVFDAFRIEVLADTECPRKRFLRHATFKQQGQTASGAPFFKAVETFRPMLPLCSVGVQPGTKGFHQPEVVGECKCSSAGRRLDGNNITGDPIGSDIHEGVVNESESEESTTMAPTTTTGSSVEDAGTSEVTGFCGGYEGQYKLTEGMHLCDCGAPDDADKTEMPAPTCCVLPDFDDDYRRQNHRGLSRSARSNHEHDQVAMYMYHDPSCAGKAEGSMRWIIGDTEPDQTADKDLDGDGECVYHARSTSEDLEMPPMGAMWHVHCGGEEWKDLWLSLERRVSDAGEAVLGAAASGPGGMATGDAARVARSSSMPALLAASLAAARVLL